ncbi:MAG TPA: CPBP family intramembrane glutamic endopeptidase [Bacillota bacterium]|nr:CPBP family intramembrane glutamic endopeptidase [Bacillota bacterium]
MLSVKPWKPDAILRLFLSVFICIYAGSLLVTLLHYPSVAAKAGASARFYLFSGGALAFLGATLLLMRLPWRLENLMLQVGLSMACFYLGLVLGGLAQKLAGASSPSVTQMVISALSFQGAALLWTEVFLREHRVSWTEAFGLSIQWPQAILLGIILACLFLPVGWGLQYVSGQVLTHLPHSPFKPEEQQSVQTLRIASSWPDRLSLGLVTILLAPMAEEILFRGILYPWIKQAGFPRLALWGTCLVFGAVHLNLVSFLPLVLLALALTALYERTNNLLAPISAHALFNGLNFTMLYLIQK